MSTLIRPLFKDKFIRRFAEGGIVSNVAEPQAPAQEPDPLRILKNFAAQTEVTHKNLDAAGDIDSILSSFAGKPKNAGDARTELAGLVGAEDAERTPDSVLALVQPTLAIMEMSKQMGPKGGIANVPMGVKTPEGFTPAQPMEMPQPMGQFAEGGEVDVAALMQKYAALQGQIPAGYGSDPSSSWLALANLGAGIATGKNFAEGLSKGTQMATPIMQQANAERNASRNALTNYVVSEQQRIEGANAQVADREDRQTHEFNLFGAQTKAQQEAAAADRQFQGQQGALNRGSDAAMHLDTLKQRRYEFDTTWERDKEKTLLELDNKLQQELIKATSEADRLKITQDFEMKKLDIMHELDKKKIAFQDSLKESETSAAERFVEERMRLTGLDPKSKEYKEMKATLIDEQLKKQGGITNNLGDTADVKILDTQLNIEEEEVKELNKSAAAARNMKAGIAPIRAILEPVRSGGRPGFETGGFGETRLKAAQVISYLDKNFELGMGDSLSRFLGGDASAGEILEASSAKLSSAASEAMARSTNIQVGIAQDMFPKLGRTPEGNLMLADILDRAADRTLMLEKYAMELKRTYSTIDPMSKPKNIRDQLMAGSGVTNFNGFKEGKTHDENGRPLMSFTEYKIHLDKTEPILKPEEIKRMQKLAESAPGSWSEAGAAWGVTGAKAPAPGAGSYKTGTILKDKETGSYMIVDGNGKIIPYAPPVGGR